MFYELDYKPKRTKTGEKELQLQAKILFSPHCFP